MVRPRATSPRGRRGWGIGSAEGRRGGWCGTGRCPGGAIAAGAGGRTVGWVRRTRGRAKWAGLHGPGKCALPWVSPASPRRPHAREFQCSECAGKAHDLPWVLDAIHVVRVHGVRSTGGDAQGGFQRSVLKPLLWGEPPAFGGVGGTLPPRLSPGGGNGKGGDSNSLLPQADSFRVTAGICLLAVNPATPYSHSKAGIPTKIGTLVVGRGTVEWWPESNRVNAHRANWYNFAEMMTTLPKK